MFKHTKIVATIGPASSEETMRNDLMKAGVAVFRLNFSHGDLDDKAMLIKRIRSASKQRQQAVAILGDLQPGDLVVSTMGCPISQPATTNRLKVHTLNGTATH